MKIFDLESDEEKETMLTHQGQWNNLWNLLELIFFFIGKAVNDIDDFKEEIEVSSVDEENHIDADVVNDFHFQGFEDEKVEKNNSNIGERRKTKQEIYKEIIHKSKKAKFEKQQLKFENQMKIEDIDNTFQSIMGLLIKSNGYWKTILYVSKGYFNLDYQKKKKEKEIDKILIVMID